MGLEGDYKLLTNNQILNRFKKIKKLIKQRKYKSSISNNIDIYLCDIFAIIREMSKRILNMRHFDVQLLGGLSLHYGNIIEMKTGEGKTLVATLPAILNSMVGKSVHIVTVNEYLALRDMS